MKPNWAVFLLIVAVWLLAYLITERRKKSRSKSGGFAIPKSRIKTPPHTATSHSRSHGVSGFQALVRACMGDSAKATRLVKFEQSKNPTLTYAQAIAAALDRLADDRSR